MSCGLGGGQGALQLAVAVSVAVVLVDARPVRPEADIGVEAMSEIRTVDKHGASSTLSLWNPYH